MHEATLEGRHVSFKKLSSGRDGDRGVAVRNEREQCFSDKGSLICPAGKSMIYFTYLASLILDGLRRPPWTLTKVQSFTKFDLSVRAKACCYLLRWLWWWWLQLKNELLTMRLRAEKQSIV